MKKILHIDFDSFFASVAQQDNPQLRGKPVGITAANGRTAIIAVSKEGKARGLKSPARSYEAQKNCPDLILWQADFTRYFEVSKKFLALCEKFSPTVELFSIDEAFMDVTDTVHLFGGVDALIQQFKQQLRTQVGEYITASVGVSYNKLLAKLASGMYKPNGVYTITPESLQEAYTKAKLTDICGIGYRTGKRLNLIGIYSLIDLQKASLAQLIHEFGNVEGHFLRDVGQGIGSTEVIPYQQRPDVKSISRNYALPKNEYNRHIVEQHIFELCEEIALKLRRLKKKAHTVGLFLRGDKNFGAHRSVTEFLDSGKELYTICHTLYASWPLSYVRMISVWVGNLQDEQYVPLSLFSNPKTSKLQTTIDTLNDKFGHNTVTKGFLINGPDLETVPNGFGNDTWERTKLSSMPDKI